MSGFREQLAEPMLLQIYDYWDSLRNGRRMPSRKDIDPMQVSKHLPDIMLVDVQHEPRRLRYRLIGTRVVAANAEDRTGRFLDDVDFIKNNPSVNKHYNSVVDNAEPFLSLEPFFNRSNSLIYQAKRLLQPLFSDDKTVDMLLTYFYFTTGPYANR